MNIGIARDLMVVAGLGAVVAGVWLVAGLGVALIVVGALMLTAGLAAEMREGDS